MPMPPHYRATFRFSRQNAQSSFSLYYVSPGTEPTADQMDDLVDQVFMHFVTPLVACFEPTTKFDGIDLRYQSSDLDREAASAYVPQDGSAAAGDILPEEDCVVLQRRTGVKGRSARGRIFVPFVPEVFALDSKLTDAGLTKYMALAAKAGDEIGAVEGNTPVLLPRHPSWKNSVLLPIENWRVVDNTCSRRDRRAPRRYRGVGSVLTGLP